MFFCKSFLDDGEVELKNLDTSYSQMFTYMKMDVTMDINVMAILDF